MTTTFAKLNTAVAKLKTLLCLAVGFFAALGVLSVTQGHPVQASTSPGVNLGTLLTQFYALQNTVNNQTSQIVALQTTVNSQASTISAMQAKTAPLSVSGTDLTISGVNVHVVDGTGATNSTSGLGNLTIGYNATGNPNGDTRTGSHNLILGDKNSYSSAGGLVAGDGNTISGPYASVSGGYNNTAGAQLASVAGGEYNIASGVYASVSGGNSVSQNTFAGWSGGPLNGAGTTLTVSGVNVRIIDGTGSTNSTSGLGNLTIGYNATGNFNGDTRTGSHNLILGDQNNYSSYGGLIAGYQNIISNQYASVSGGYGNTASGISASVSGGGGNTAKGTSASVSGGESNNAISSDASVSGGANNSASANYAAVSGGNGITQNHVEGWSGGSQGSTAYSGKFTSP